MAAPNFSSVRALIFDLDVRHRFVRLILGQRYAAQMGRRSCTRTYCVVSHGAPHWSARVGRNAADLECGVVPAIFLPTHISTNWTHLVPLSGRREALEQLAAYPMAIRRTSRCASAWASWNTLSCQIFSRRLRRNTLKRTPIHAAPIRFCASSLPLPTSDSHR